MADGAAAPEEEVTFEGGDQLQELLSAADFADAGRSSGRRAKSKAKPKREQRRQRTVRVRAVCSGFPRQGRLRDVKRTEASNA